MRKLKLLIVLVLVVGAVLAVWNPSTVLSQVLPQKVTVTELLKNPDGYVGKLVTVTGFLNFTGEDNVYSSTQRAYVRVELYTLRAGPSVFVAKVQSGLSAEDIQTSRAIYNDEGVPVGSTYLKVSPITGTWQVVTFGNKKLYAIVVQ